MPWQPAENNGTGVLRITTGDDRFVCCKVVFSPNSLVASLPLTRSSILCPPSLSPIFVPLTPSLCNHILYTIGSQSNLMHRYSLIKLICGDPLLQSVLDSFMPPIPKRTLVPHIPVPPPSSLAAPQSARNATHFVKMLLLIIS